MNISKLTDAFKQVGLFLTFNITAIFFLLGIIVINVAVYLWDMQWGLIGTGVSLIVVALIINGETEKR